MERKNKIWTLGVLTGILLLLNSFSVFAQTKEKADTLTPSVITALRRLDVGIGEIRTDVTGMRMVVSPMGEGDPIRWVQSLPGVSTGADGTSAMYIRGGNMGGNVVTLDGIPVYGYSHLLGLTTAIPSDVLQKISLSKGGFSGRQGNYTSSHLALFTNDAIPDKLSAQLSLNNFLAGAHVSGAITPQIAVTLFGRLSPLTWEYNALKGLLGGGLGDLDPFEAQVYDLYGKIYGTIGEHAKWSLSGTGSQDRYSFVTPDTSSQTMGWSNAIGIATFRYKGFDIMASYNAYSNIQEQDKQYMGTDNHLSLQSDLTEITVSAGYKTPVGRFFDWEMGAKGRFARFSPKKMGTIASDSNTSLVSAYLQGKIHTRKIEMTGSLRLNRFQNDSTFLAPDVSLSARWQIAPFLAVEGTFDWMRQYYHTLEGLPVGWSMDMLVPTSSLLPEEIALQGYIGAVATFGDHSLTTGVFSKKLDNLIYYKDAQNLFSAIQTTWEEDIDMGQGDSFGVEVLYEFQRRNWYARASATISKSTRWGFSHVNDGKPFHAPFDRMLVLNMAIEYKDWRLNFIYQDGNWVNGRAEHYVMHIPGDNPTLDYYAAVNNHQMPAVIRLDAGYQHTWQGKHVQHTLNLGICNLLNHFNPFTVYYDTIDNKWKEIALLPVLPNFSYRFSF